MWRIKYYYRKVFCFIFKHKIKNLSGWTEYGYVDAYKCTRCGEQFGDGLQ